MDNLNGRNKKSKELTYKDNENKLKNIFTMILFSIPLLLVLMYFAAINSSLAATNITLSMICGGGVCLSYVLLSGKYFVVYKKIKNKQDIWAAGGVAYNKLFTKYKIFYFFIGTICFSGFLVFAIKNNLLESLVFFSFGYLLVLLLAHAHKTKLNIDNITKDG